MDIIIVRWILSAVICGIAGGVMLNRFHNEGTGVLLGLLLGPIGLVIAWTMRDNAKLAAATTPSVSPSGAGPRDERECPYCAELILKKARVCKHCGRELEPLLETVRPASPANPLQSPDAEVRFLAADRLGERGAAALDALPQLQNLANSDPDSRVRDRAQWAVAEIRRKSSR